MSARAHRPWISVLAVASFLGAWELVARLELVSPILVSSPTRVARALVALTASGAIADDLAFTLSVFGLGLALSVTAGITLGVAMGVSAIAYDALNPFVVSASALPKIVLMPIVVLWFGIGLAANVFLATLMGSFPILTNVHAGVKSLDRDLVLLARAYGASRWMLWREVVLPSVTPFVVSGLRVAVSYAMVGALIAEFFASSEGIGYRMTVFMAAFEVDAFFACVVIVAGLVMAFTGLVHAIERRVEGWRPDALDARPGM